MILIHDYRIVETSNGLEECRSREASAVCPDCGGSLVYRDRKKRIYRNVHGQRRELMIRRLRCSFCGELHSELPDFILPYKQCTAETVEKTLEMLEMNSEDAPEDTPDLLTMQRWWRWIEAVLFMINSKFQVCCKLNFYISNFIFLEDMNLILAKLIGRGRGWLCAVVDFYLLNRNVIGSID